MVSKQNETELVKTYETAECILFGYPGECDLIKTINYCILTAKYFVYIRKLFNNNDLDFYQYLVLLKHHLSLEEIACQSKGKIEHFEKYRLIYDAL